MLGFADSATRHLPVRRPDEAQASCSTDCFLASTYPFAFVIQANLISTYHVVFRDLAKRSPERTCDAFENVGFGIPPLHSVCLASGARRHGVLVLPLDSEALLRRNRVSHLGFRSFNPQSSYPQGLIVFALGCLFPFLSLLRRLRIRCKCSFRKSCTPIL
jgi:hypothetical protein